MTTENHQQYSTVNKGVLQSIDRSIDLLFVQFVQSHNFSSLTMLVSAFWTLLTAILL